MSNWMSRNKTMKYFCFKVGSCKFSWQLYVSILNSIHNEESITEIHIALLVWFFLINCDRIMLCKHMSANINAESRYAWMNRKHYLPRIKYHLSFASVTLKICLVAQNGIFYDLVERTTGSGNWFISVTDWGTWSTGNSRVFP